MTTESRKAFEEHYGHFSKPSYDVISNAYNDSSIQKCWLSWQASRQHIIDKLNSPEFEEMAEQFGYKAAIAAVLEGM